MVDEIKEKSKKLFNKDFFLLWQGQSVSQLGNHIFSVAMILWIKAATDSASLIGLLGMVSGIPAVILGAIGGTFADRHSRRKIIIITDVFNGIFILSLAGIFYFFPNSGNIHLYWLFTVFIFSAIMASFFLPAITAAIPDLVHKDHLSKANSMNQFSGQLAMFIGQGVGGILFMALGAPLLILINGFTFLFSAVSEYFIKIPQVLPEKKEKISQQFGSFLGDIREGLSFILKSPGLRNLIFASIFLTFFTVPILILLPFYVEDFLHAEGYWYGIILSFYGLGSLLGFLLAGGLRINGRLRASLTTKFMVANAIVLGILIIASSPYHAIIISVISGLFSGFISINVITVVQQTTPSATRGRVFGFISAFSGSITPLGMGLSGVIADMTGQNIPIIYLVCSMFLLLVSIFILFNRQTKKFLAYEEKSESGDIPPEEDLIRQALIQRENGNYYKAIQLLGSALHYNRRDEKLLYYLGLVNYELENYNEANWYLRQLLSISPRNHKAQILQAANYFKKNMISAAERILESMLATAPHQKTALLNLAVLYRLQNRIPESIGLFEQYVRIFPEDIRGYAGLIQNYDKIDNPAGVSRYMKKAEKLNAGKIELKELLEMKLYSETIAGEDISSEQPSQNFCSPVAGGIPLKT